MYEVIFLLYKSAFILKYYTIHYYTRHWDKTQILKKFPSGKINVTKNALFSFVRSTWSQFYFQQFLYWAEAKGSLAKTVCGIFHFRFRLVFLFIKKHGLFDCKRHNSFQNGNNRKANHSFYPKSLKIQWYQPELELPKNWVRYKLSKFNRCFKYVVFSQ